MFNNTKIVLNEAEAVDRYYDLESRFTILSDNFSNTYTQVVLDCCREPISLNQMRGGETIEEVKGSF